MTGTLREQYRARQLNSLQERVKKIDQALLLEERTARLLIEAMDEEDLQKVSAIIDKLRKLKRPELPILTKAIEQAEAEINKYTAGGPIAKAWGKLKKLVGVDNPIVKVTTFASALEKGFSQIPQILKNNGVDLEALQGADLNQSLATYVAQKTGAKKTGEKSDAEMAKSPFTGKQVEGQLREANVEITGKLKDIVNQLRTALSPGGIFGAFKKVPYADGAALAQELVQAPLKVFSLVSKTINQGTKAAEIAPDMKGLVTGKGDVETKGSIPGEPTKPGEAAAATAGGKPTTASTKSVAAGEQPAQPRGGGAPSGDTAKKAFSSLKDAEVGKKYGVSDGALEAILSHLADQDMLK